MVEGERKGGLFGGFVRARREGDEAIYRASTGKGGLYKDGSVSSMHELAVGGEDEFCHPEKSGGDGCGVGKTVEKVLEESPCTEI